MTQAEGPTRHLVSQLQALGVAVLQGMDRKASQLRKSSRTSQMPVVGVSF